MNNAEVAQLLDDCKVELDHVKTLVDGLGPASTIGPYLSRYAVIRACGAVETGFKAVIADFCSWRSKRQVKRFLARRIRDGSANPSFELMCKFLNDFDDGWKKSFKTRVNAEPTKNQLLTSLQSLVDARNDFAHGGHPIVTISDVLKYFQDSRRILEIMDDVVG